MKMKGYCDSDLHRHWISIFQSRFKFPAFHRFNCLFIKPHSKAFYHPDMAGVAVGFHNHQECTSILKAHLARLL